MFRLRHGLRRKTVSNNTGIANDTPTGTFRSSTHFKIRDEQKKKKINYQLLRTTRNHVIFLTVLPPNDCRLPSATIKHENASGFKPRLMAAPPIAVDRVGDVKIAGKRKRTKRERFFFFFRRTHAYFACSGVVGGVPYMSTIDSAKKKKNTSYKRRGEKSRRRSVALCRGRDSSDGKFRAKARRKSRDRTSFSRRTRPRKFVDRCFYLVCRTRFFFFISPPH